MQSKEPHKEQSSGQLCLLSPLAEGEGGGAPSSRPGSAPSQWAKGLLRTAPSHSLVTEGELTAKAPGPRTSPTEPSGPQHPQKAAMDGFAHSACGRLDFPGSFALWQISPLRVLPTSDCQVPRRRARPPSYPESWFSWPLPTSLSPSVAGPLGPRPLLPVLLPPARVESWSHTRKPPPLCALETKLCYPHTPPATDTQGVKGLPRPPLSLPDHFSH